MGIKELTISSDFLNAKERMWQAIWDYDFAATGVPGLTTRPRYRRDDNSGLAAFAVDEHNKQLAR